MNTPTRLLALHVSAVLGFTAYVVYTGALRGLEAGGLALGAIAVPLMILAPRFPAIAIAVFIAATYSLPRYGPDLQALIDLGLFNVLALLGLTGVWAWRANAGPNPPPMPWAQWPLLTMAMFVGWAFVSFVTAQWLGPDIEFDARHHPAQLLHGAVLMLLGAMLLDRRRAAWLVVASLCLVPFVQVLLQRDQGIYLESDLPAVAVVALPFALLTTSLPLQWAWRVFFGLVSAGLLGIVWAAQNRGAAVGLAVALLTLWLNGRKRLIWLLVAALVAVVASALAPRAYFDRFSVIWNPNASHATAALDRSTMEDRKQLWREGWLAIQTRPWLGVGPGRETQALAEARGRGGRVPTHNSFLSAAVEAGLVGLALFAALFLGTIVQLQILIRRGIDPGWRQQARMVQAALCAYVGVGLVLSRYDMPLAYLLLGWALALAMVAGRPRGAVIAAPRPMPEQPHAAAPASALPADGVGSATPSWFRYGVMAYAMFVVYGSLVPLHLTPHDLHKAWQTFWQLPASTLGTGDRSDWAVNFLLLVPLAFGWRQLRAPLSGERGWWVSIVMAVALLVYSLGIEFAQMFFPPRNPSFNDVAAQFAGSLVGLGLQHRFGPAFGRFLQRFRGAVAGQPARLHTLLGLYLAVLLAFSVMPLDLSVSPIEIYRKWLAGLVILLPFGTPIKDLGLWFYGLATDIALWVPVGLLWRIDGRGRTLRAVLLRVLLASAAIELAQLLVLSRVTDVTDVLLALVGAGLGVALAAVGRASASIDPAGLGRLALLAWCLWLPSMLALFWWPFDFSVARLFDGNQLQALTRMPFDTYFSRTEFGALNEIVRKMAFFLPGGLLLALATPRARAGRFSALPWLLVVLALVVEAGQVMLADRVADLTDAALEAAGGWLGWRLGLWLRAAPRAADAGGTAVPAVRPT